MADLDALINAPFPEQQPRTLDQKINQAGSTSVDDLVNQPFADEHAAPQVSPSGQSIEPMSGWRGSGADKGVQGFINNLVEGGADITKFGAATKLIANPNLTIDDVKGDVENEVLQKAMMEDADWHNTRVHSLLFRMRDLPWGDQQDESFFSAADIPGALVKQIPMTGLALGAGLAGASIAATVGAPLLAGSLLGGAVATGLVIGGAHIYDSMKMGIKREHAIAGGIVTGAIGGLATTVGVGKMLASHPETARIFVKSPQFREAVAQVSARMLSAFGVNEAGAAAQAATDAGMRMWETSMKGNAAGVAPMPLSAALRQISQSVVLNAFPTAIVEGGVTLHGVHAGLRAVKRNAELETKILEAKHAEAQQKLQEENQIKLLQLAQDEQTAQAISVAQTKAKKQLRGFVEARGGGDVASAEANYEQAKKNFAKATDEQKHQARLELTQVEAEYKQAQHEAKIKAVEDALTNPNLVAETAEHIKDLTRRIDTLQHELEWAETPKEKEALAVAISRAQGQLRELKALHDLGSDAKIREKLSAQKSEVESKAKAYELAAKKTEIERRIAARGKYIDQLKGEIKSAKAENKALNEEIEQELEKIGLKGYAIEHAIEDLQVRIAAGKRGLKDSLARLQEAQAGAQTSELRAKLEKAQWDQEVDKMLLSMAKDKSISAADLAEINAKVPTQKLFGVVKVAKKMLDQASKDATGAANKTTKAAKKLLDGVIDSSRLPKRDRDELKGLYGHLDAKELAEVLPEVERQIKERFVKIQTKAARHDLTNLLGTLDESIKDRTKFPGQVEMLDTIRAFANDHEQVALLQKELSEKAELTALDEQRLDIAQELFPVPVENMSAAQIEKLIDAIVQLKETGKAEALRWSNERQEVIDGATKAFIEHATPRDGGASFAQREDMAKKIWKAWNDKFVVAWDRWPGVMSLVTQLGKITDFSNVRGLDILNGLDRYYKLQHKWKSRLEELISEKFTKKEWNRYMLNMAKPAERLRYLALEESENLSAEVETVLENRNVEDVGGKLSQFGPAKPYTKEELQQIYNWLQDQDPNAQGHFKDGNKWTKKGEVAEGYSTEEVIEDYLDSTLPKWRDASAAYKQFFSEFFSVMRENAKMALGRELEINPTYFGPLHVEVDQPLRETFRLISVKSKSVISRVGGSQPVKVIGAYTNLMRHLEAGVRMNALHEYERVLPAVFMKNKEVRGFIERNIGSNTLEVIDAFINDMLLNARKTEGFIGDFADWLRESLYTHYLGARPEQYPKQLTGALQALQLISVEELLDGWAYMEAYPEKAKAMMQESGFYVARKATRTPDMSASPKGALRRFNAKWMGAVEAGDHTAVDLGGFPVMLAEYKKTGSMEAAVEAMGRFIATQGSNVPANVPHMLRGSAWFRLIGVMGNEPLGQISTLNVAWRKFFNSPSPKAAGHILRIYGITALGAYLYGMVGVACNLPFTDPEKSLERGVALTVAAPLGPLASIPVLGSLLSSMAVNFASIQLNYKMRTFEPKLISVSVVEDFDKFAKSVMKAGASGDIDDYLRAMKYASDVAGSVAGVPSSAIIQKAKPFLEGSK